MLIPSGEGEQLDYSTSLSRRVNANSQLVDTLRINATKLIKKGEC